MNGNDLISKGINYKQAAVPEMKQTKGLFTEGHQGMEKAAGNRAGAYRIRDIEFRGDYPDGIVSARMFCMA